MNRLSESRKDNDQQQNISSVKVTFVDVFMACISIMILLVVTTLSLLSMGDSIIKGWEFVAVVGLLVLLVGIGIWAVNRFKFPVENKNTSKDKDSITINTGGGSYFAGNVTSGNDFVGRDKSNNELS